MGKPKFSRKKYETPSHPWQEDRIKEENELVKKYGLKNKREIWKAQTRLKKCRSQARGLLAKFETGDTQSKKESKQLLVSLNRLNILPLNSTLDDVLALTTESILSRRLQTLTYLKGFAGTPTQARQLISHGHISIGEKKVTVPGYLVTKDEENDISYMASSPLNDTMHPARPKADFKSVPIKRETTTEEETKPKKEESKPEEQKTEPDKPTSEIPVDDKPAEKTPEQPKEEKPQEPKTLTEPEKTEKATVKEKTEPKESEKVEENKEGGK